MKFESLYKNFLSMPAGERKEFFYNYSKRRHEELHSEPPPTDRIPRVPKAAKEKAVKLNPAQIALLKQLGLA